MAIGKLKIIRFKQNLHI